MTRLDECDHTPHEQSVLFLVKEMMKISQETQRLHRRYTWDNRREKWRNTGDLWSNAENHRRDHRSNTLEIHKVIITGVESVFSTLRTDNEWVWGVRLHAGWWLRWWWGSCENENWVLEQCAWHALIFSTAQNKCYFSKIALISYLSWCYEMFHSHQWW